MFWFHVWESILPLCIVPQVFHFPELVVWCAEHFSHDSNSIVYEQLSQIVINISRESITKMLGLHITGFPNQNVVTLSKEILVQKFTSATPQVQLSFVQAIQRAKYVTPILEFPIKADACPAPYNKFCPCTHMSLVYTMTKPFLKLFLDFSCTYLKL